jgi:predicted permease
MSAWKKLKYLLPSHRRAQESEMREELDSLAAIAGPRELGNLTLAAENARAAWGWTWFERLAQDLRYAARSLRGSPAFTLVAVLTLALGIGANTTIFTALNAVFLTKLPVHQPDRLRQLSWSSRKRAFGGKSLMQPMYDAYFLNKGETIVNFSYPVYQNLRDKAASFSDVACERSTGAMTFVSANFFRTVGLDAILGRTFTPDDDRPAASPTAVISYGYWQSAFGGDPQALNRTIARDQNGRALSTAMTIVGILPQDYFGLNPASAGARIYTPRQPAALQPPAVSSALTDDRNWNACDAVIARLRPGVSDEQARAESETLVAQAILANPPDQPYELPRITLINLDRGQNALRKLASLPLLILTCTTVVILLIACANIAGLLLARGTARRKEIATRLALGAARSRIVRQLLTEGLLLSAIGATAGIAIAYVASPWLPRLLTQQNSFGFGGLGVTIRPDARVAGFSLLLAVLTALLFGLAPALHATRMDLLAMMKIDAPARRRFHFASGKIMLAVQVTLSMLLLTGAGLFIRTLLNLRAVPMGYQPKGLLYFVVDNGGKGVGTIDEVIERLKSVSGVTSATASMWPLFTSAPDTYLQVCVPGDASYNFDDRFADSDVILPQFFKTWGVPVLRGRDFVSTDRPGQVIVNEAFVKRFLAGEADPIGQTIHLGPGCAAATIVGVAANSTDRPRITPRPFVYRRYAQPPPQVTFAVRTRGTSAAVAPALQDLLSNLNVTVDEGVTTGEQYRNDTMLQERLFAGLLSAFGSVALFIACLGIYGMLAYLVTRRTAEIGIRVALGAQRTDVMRMVIRESLAPVTLGLIVGIAAAGALTKFAASVLFGVSRNDPWTIAGAGLVFLLTAAVAAALPARRASGIDPMRALRHE